MPMGQPYFFLNIYGGNLRAGNTCVNERPVFPCMRDRQSPAIFRPPPFFSLATKSLALVGQIEGAMGG